MTFQPEKQFNIKKRLTIGLLLVVFFMTFFSPTIQAVYADSAGSEVVTNLDNTRVMDDLLSADGFNILNYPFDDSFDGPENTKFVINLVEYCYTYKLDLQSNYALYIYVYNPRGDEIDTIRTNKITMAVEFDSELKPSRYDKFTLKYCDASTGAYANLFYKFKIENAEFFLAQLNSLQRNYYISEIELQLDGFQNAPTNNISTLYKFSGYAQGFGSDPTQSTLDCEATAIESIELEVKHTYFRTGEMSYNYQASQINSVYFAVPNETLDRYGNLYAIHAEWWEYMTREIFITSWDSMAEDLLNFTGVDIYNSSSSPNYAFGFAGPGYDHVNTLGWGYNVDLIQHKGVGVTPYAFNKLKTLYYVFCSEGATGKYTLNNNILKNYIYDYSKTFKTGTLDVNNKIVSADLFLSEEEFVSEYWSSKENNATRKMGYNNVNITIEDAVNMKTITQNNWWQNLWGLDKKVVEQEIPPIITVESDILNLSNSQIANKYLISSNEVNAFKNYYQEQTLNNNTIVLFRFASTNYRSQSLDIYHIYQNWLGWTAVGRTFDHPSAVAQENIFLDFDIIDLTFTNDGKYYVIPVVASPIDIISDVEVLLPTPTNWWNWLLVAFIIIAILICMPLIIKLFKLLYEVVVWLLSLPFVLIEMVSRSRGAPDS